MTKTHLCQLNSHYPNYLDQFEVAVSCFEKASYSYGLSAVVSNSEVADAANVPEVVNRRREIAGYFRHRRTIQCGVPNPIPFVHCCVHSVVSALLNSASPPILYLSLFASTYTEISHVEQILSGTTFELFFIYNDNIITFVEVDCKFSLICRKIRQNMSRYRLCWAEKTWLTFQQNHADIQQSPRLLENL